MHTVDISSTTCLPSLVNIAYGRPLTCDLCTKSSFGVPFSICLKTKLLMDEPLLLGRDIEISNNYATSYATFDNFVTPRKS